MPKTVEETVEQWRKHPHQKVLLIDETRLHLDGEHREFIVFMAVLMEASALIAHLKAMFDVRESLPRESLKESFKGKNLLHIFPDDDFRPLVLTIGKALVPPTRLFIAATTMKNLQDSKAKVVIRSANSTNRPPDVRGLELKLAVHFIRQLGDDLAGPSGCVDVILDRSKALGLDANTRHLEEGGFEGFFGTLKNGGPHFSIVPDSDDGIFRDALLVPDFAAYLLVHKAPGRLNDERARVTSGTPFFYREVLSRELVPALAMVTPTS